MTLILSSLNPVNAVQVSDRRVMYGDGTWNDDTNKAFVCVCDDARVIVGFSGLAKTGDFDTYRWILTTLAEGLKQSNYKFAPALQHLQTSLQEKFLELSPLVNDSHRRLSVIATGFDFYNNVSRPHIWMVSNFDAIHEDEPSELASPHFELSDYALPPQQSSILPIGTEAGITDQELDHLGRFVKTNQDAKIIQTSIKMLRKAAKSAWSSGRISENCSSIVLPADPQQPFTATYHTDRQGRTSFNPGLLVAGQGPGIFLIAESKTSTKPAKRSI